MLVYRAYLVLFFKQKTAYEMRIRDWSSDVCSSDLCTALVTAAITSGRSGEASLPVGSPSTVICASLSATSSVSFAFTDSTDTPGKMRQLTLAVAPIGSASCRGRVGQVLVDFGG